MSAVFTLPSWQRLLVATAYAVAVGLAVWAVEAAPAAALPPVVAPTARSAQLRVEATFPVASWTVLVDGVAVAGAATAQLWTGSVTGSEVLVQAERADAADQSSGALRLGLGPRRILAWGEGTVSVTAAIE